MIWPPPPKMAKMVQDGLWWYLATLSVEESDRGAPYFFMQIYLVS
jgi:hypothetical protein